MEIMGPWQPWHVVVVVVAANSQVRSVLIKTCTELWRPPPPPPPPPGPP
eukprot:COSAG01_NODE_33733_length_559_cov_2.495652_1_plen_48_part_01